MYLTFTNLGRLGSLGNQLFQIAATIGIARSLAMQPIFPAWRYAEKFSEPISQSTEVFGNLQIYREPSFTYQPPLITGSANLVGFFQSKRYFSAVQNDVRQMLTPCEEIRSMCKGIWRPCSA